MALTEVQRERARNIRANINKAVNIAKTDNTNAITVSGLFPAWSQSAVYAVGDPVRYNDYPYKCIIAHNAAHYAGWSENLWKPYHGTTPGTALPYIMPGGHAPYMTGEYVKHNEAIYKCIENNTVYSPSVFPAFWELVTDGAK